MTKLPDKSVLERAAKLKALTTSDNANEAANAHAALQRLLLQHEIDIEAIDSLDPAKAAVGANIDLDSPIYAGSTPLPEWQIQLLLVLANHVGCAEFHAPDTTHTMHMWFVAGRRQDVAYVKALWSRTVTLLTRLSQKEFSRMRRSGHPVTPPIRRAWLLGAVDGIEAQLRQVDEEFAANPVTTSAITTIDARRSAAELAIERLTQGCQKIEGDYRARLDSEAYGAGHDAGKNMSVRLPASLGTRAPRQPKGKQP